MKIAYNSVLPVVFSRCKQWPNGKYFSQEDKGREIEVSDKFGTQMLKTGWFVQVKQRAARQQETNYELEG